MEMEYGQNYVVLVHKGVSFVTKFARPHSNKTKFSSEVSSYLLATSIKRVGEFGHILSHPTVESEKSKKSPTIPNKFFEKSKNFHQKLKKNH